MSKSFTISRYQSFKTEPSGMGYDYQPEPELELKTLRLTMKPILFISTIVCLLEGIVALIMLRQLGHINVKAITDLIKNTNNKTQIFGIHLLELLK